MSSYIDTLQSASDNIDNWSHMPLPYAHVSNLYNRTMTILVDCSLNEAPPISMPLSILWHLLLQNFKVRSVLSFMTRPFSRHFPPLMTFINMKKFLHFFLTPIISLFLNLFLIWNGEWTKLRLVRPKLFQLSLFLLPKLGSINIQLNSWMPLMMSFSSYDRWNVIDTISLTLLLFRKVDFSIRK